MDSFLFCLFSSKIFYHALSEIPSEWQNKPFIEVVFTLIEKNLSQNREKAWLSDAETGEKLPLKDLHSRALKTAEVLAFQGLKRGQTVHILLHNCVQFHVAVFGVWLLGIVIELSSNCKTKVGPFSTGQ